MINASGGNDQIFGEDGADTIDAGYGDNTVQGGAGDDLLTAGVGAYNILRRRWERHDQRPERVVPAGARRGLRTMYSASGAGMLTGDDGNDTLNGRASDDTFVPATLVGGAGDDRLVGGQRRQSFRWRW